MPSVPLVLYPNIFSCLDAAGLVPKLYPPRQVLYLSTSLILLVELASYFLMASILSIAEGLNFDGFFIGSSQVSR
jgi:hypothetical protein